MIVLITLVILYFMVIGYYAIPWWNRKYKFVLKAPKELKGVSIIMAVRNEEFTLRNAIDSILSNMKEEDELIVVNDHSNDDSLKILETYYTRENVKILSLETQTGKQAAILNGIEASKNEVILLTDADCLVSEDWIDNHRRYYRENGYSMVVAPVSFVDETILQSIFLIEYLPLLGLTFSSAYYRRPLLANGSNLSFLKKKFFEVNGYDGLNSVSGDDVLLLEKFIRNFGRSRIAYCFSQGNIVKTRSPESIKEFMQQRTRWSKKMLKGKLKQSNWLFILIALMNVLLISYLPYSIGAMQIDQWLFVYSLKVFVDLILIIPIIEYLNKPKLFILAIPFAIVYPVYFIYMGLNTMFIKVTWKGRSI